MTNPEWHKQMEQSLRVPTWEDLTWFTLRQMIIDYIAEIETSLTNEICLCEWLIHPDDWKFAADVCRTCGVTRLSHSVKNSEDPETHAFTGRRMRRGEQHPECPVHTKEGFLLGFFKWIGAPEPTND